MDPEQWLANYDRRLARVAADAQAAEASLRQIGGVAASPRGEVVVKVGPSGALEDLTLTAAARAMEADQLARLILATSQQARSVVGAQVVEIMTDYLGDGPALDVVKQSLPVPPAEPVDNRDDDSYFSSPPEIFT